MVENAPNRHKGFIGAVTALMPGRRRLEARLAAAETARDALAEELRALRTEREALMAQMVAVGGELRERQAQAGTHAAERDALLRGIARLLEEQAAREPGPHG